MRQYAQRRGVSEEAVRKAVERGRLSASVERVEAHERVWTRITNVELADREWEANTDLTRGPVALKAAAAERNGQASAPGVQPSISLAEAAAEEKRRKAERAKMDFEVRAGSLLPAQAVEAQWVEILGRIKARALALPSKAKQVIPHLTPADVQALTRIVREMLEELARPAAEGKEGAA
jgi:hypothetical protein